MDRGARTADRLDRGFSLVEIVIALAVLALILGIALPAYLGSLSVGGKPGTSVVNTKSNKAAVDEAAVHGGCVAVDRVHLLHPEPERVLVQQQRRDRVHPAGRQVLELDLAAAERRRRGDLHRRRRGGERPR